MNRSIALLLSWSLALCPGLLRAGETAMPASSRPPRVVAVEAAFQPELDAIEAEIFAGQPPGTRTEHNGTTFVECDRGGLHLVLFLSGISMVNAALTTQAAIDRYHPGLLLFCGIAGAVNPELRPGDVAVPAGWIHQAEAAWLNPDPHAPDHYILPPRFQEKYGHFGSIFPKDVRVVRAGQTTPESVHEFPADPALLSVATAAAAEAVVRRPDGAPARVLVGGTGMSGPVFLDNRDFREWAFREWHVNLHEMEGTAVAQVAYVNRLPVLVVRGISDLAGGQPGQNEEVTFGPLAAKNAATVLGRVLDRLGTPEAAPAAAPSPSP